MLKSNNDFDAYIGTSDQLTCDNNFGRLQRESSYHLKRSSIETFQHIDRAQDDPHAIRAEELRALNDFNAAERIARCSLASPFYYRTCKRRDCPTCSQRVAYSYRQRMVICVRQMSKPLFFLVSYPSKNLYDLSAAIDGFRNSLVRIAGSRT